ncbi:MAG: DnaD domain protein [Bacillota bacterium]
MNCFRFRANNEDLHNTIIENAFINHYMPKAPGDYVKVYLLGLKYTSSPSYGSISNDIMARTLSLSEEEVVDAWKYWEQQGIVKLTADAYDTDGYTIEFISIKELFLNIKGKQKEHDKYSPDRIITARQNNRIREMFEYMKRIMGREPSQSEMFTFLDWIDDYSFSPEVVILLLEDCYSRNKKDLPYLKQVAKNWFDAGIKSAEMVAEYSAKHREKWQKYSKVISFLRIGRQPTAPEEELLHKWFYTYSFSEDIVLKACELTSQTIKPSFSYIDKILGEWYKCDLKTLQEVEAYLLKTESRKDKPAGKDVRSSKSFSNFANRNYDTKVLKENLLKKGRGELSE